VFPKASALIRLTYPRIGGVTIRFLEETFAGTLIFANQHQWFVTDESLG
tara:strand:- start:17255 stop:17401 length:147 start_codon:yes stop_codon:yes gene_type:complete